MKDIQIIIKKICIIKKLQYSFNEKSIVVFNNFYYIFMKIQNNKIVIHRNWRFKILGYFIFKKKYLEMISLYNEIVTVLRKENFNVEEIVKN
ncbi:MAG: hypothetical protein COZ76_12115 [Flavobacteriales bacterium CG_4_8_14_3_um_filter_35_10]|nr:MAG: hypothetical protein COZ76_12115 [Flavobacteriales bacterium CG_4_8_14_3_um_filter_35_10]